MQIRGLASRNHEYRKANMSGMDALGTDEAGSATDAANDVHSALLAVLGPAGAGRKASEFQAALARAQHAAIGVHYATDALEAVMSEINATLKNRTGETIF